MGTDTEFEPYLNHSGDPHVRARDWDRTACLSLRDAQAMHHALGQAIAEAQSLERRFEYQVASAENEAAE